MLSVVLVVLAAVLLCGHTADAFNLGFRRHVVFSRVSRASAGLGLTMEYIPDGLTKAQWDALKKKEEADLKAKGNLGALGTTKFKSR